MKTTHPLRSTWEFRHEGAGDRKGADRERWQPIEIPGTFEAAGALLDDPGPYWLRTTFPCPPFEPGERVWIRFDAVSYACEVFIGDRKIWDHLGTWNPFRVELTEHIRPDELIELNLRIEKPASPTAGYQSPTVRGSYPMRETLAGFPPYIWGHSFGGVWQGVFLEVTGAVVIEDVWADGKPDGAVRISVALSGGSEATLEIVDPGGETLKVPDTLKVSKTGQTSGDYLEFDLPLPDPQPWSPQEPSLYTARISVPDGDSREVRFGLRSVAADGDQILLNGSPVYLRMVLSWGWYPEHIAPDPGPERVRADLLRLKEMGYNGVKLCLWVPPQYYFDLADELGMLLWVELPVWLPVMSVFFKRTAPVEFGALMRLVRNHPAVVLYTVGCELNDEADPATVRRLFGVVKRLAPDALVRDNSGSSEAYGGSLDESADFYDHHFYAELQFMRSMLDAFTPGWREKQPWVFGEFCDYDTLRDIPAIQARYPEPRWWETDNPQGIRAAVDVVDQPGRLQASGLWDEAGRLHALSVRQSLLHRKVTIELVRSRPETAGYVVTGERDSPIATAGMWDDLGASKFDPEEFRQFNGDTVVMLGWRRDRRWVVRGDRPVFHDFFCYRSGEAVRAQLVISHFGIERGPALFSWRVLDASGAVVSLGSGAGGLLVPGEVREIGLAEVTVPQVERAMRVDLQVRVEFDGKIAENAWPLYFFPPDPWAGIGPVHLHDPRRRLDALAAQVRLAPAGSGVGIFTVWEPGLAAWIAGGGSGILLLERDDLPAPVRKVELPFWREAVKFAVPHTAWGDFPEPGDPGLQFYGLAPDVALDMHGFEEKWGPILRRVDARQILVHEYVVELEIGRGRLIVSTLRPDGGLGDQPSGVEYNPAGAHLLACWVRYLERPQG